MQDKRILFTICHAPYAHHAGQEALDAVLSAAAMGLDVSICFAHDGVFQLKTQQNNNHSIRLKQYTKTFLALADFEVEKIYVLQQSLLSRGLDARDLTIAAELIDLKTMQELMAVNPRVLVF